jgi:hypothetical protein
MYDKLLLKELILNKDGKRIRTATVERKHDESGSLIGTYDQSPTLNTRIYLADGHLSEYSANFMPKLFIGKLLMMYVTRYYLWKSGP